MDKIFRAFVIMPFDSEFNSIYEQLIKLSLEEAGYEVARADSITDQQNILRDIVGGIATADLIVADLTTLNANVFYELGLCHGLKIPTVLLAQSIDEVPFDLRSYRVQVYETRFDRIHRLKQSLKEIAEKHKRGEVTFGSPIIDFYPQSIGTKVTAASDEDEEREQDTPEEDDELEDDEKGGADYAADIEEAFEVMTDIAIEIGEINDEHTARIESFTTQLQKLKDNPPPGAASKRRGILTQVATDMNQWSKKLEHNIPDFEKCVETLDNSFAGFINFVEKPSTEDDKLAISNARQTFSDFIPQTHSGVESFRALQKVVDGLRGLSKDVNRASRRFSQVIGDVIQNMERVEAFAVRAVALIDDRFGDGDIDLDKADA